MEAAPTGIETATRSQGRKGPGRPGKCTPENQAAILRNIRLGLHLKDAVAAIPDPIDYSTFSHWARDVDEHGEASEYFDFFAQLKRAELVGKKRRVLRISQAGERDWHADAWILARRWPDEWAEQSKRTVQHTGSITVQVDHILSTPDLGRMLGLLAPGEPDVVDSTATEVPADTP